MDRKYWVAGGAAGLVVVVFAVWFLIFRDTAPEEVTLDDALGAVSTTTTSTTDGESDSTTTTTTGSADGSLDGTWVIDTTVGDGQVDNSSFVGYRVQEELASIGAKTAVGRTTGVSGTFEFSGTTLSAASVVADLTGLTSDSRGRDGQMRTQALETNTFPEATFTLTSPVDLGAVPVDGQPFSVEAAGELTIHGVTQPVTIPIEGQLTGDTVVVVGRTRIIFDDYDIERPRAAVVLSVEDEGEMEFQLFLTRS